VQDPVRTYVINPDNNRLLVGQQRTLVLDGRPETGQHPAKRLAGWTSSNPAVAQVSDSGVVTAIAPGGAIVSVRFAGETFNATVFVPTMSGPLRFSQLSALGSTTCGLATNGAAYCWGLNTAGILGSTEPIDHCFHYRFPQRPEFGYTLILEYCAMVPVRVQSPVAFASIDLEEAATGRPTGCGLSADGQAFCWGATSEVSGAADGAQAIAVGGPLRFRSFRYPCGVTTGGDAWCWGDPALRGTPGATAASPSQVPGAGSWRIVTGGGLWKHRCGLTTAGTISCWGDNSYGQLGTGDSTAAMTPVAVRSTVTFVDVGVSPKESCALSTAGLIYCWGSGRPVPEPISTTRTFTTLMRMFPISACGLATDGFPYCRIGVGFAPEPIGPTTMPFRSAVVEHGTDAFRSCGIAESGLTYCWGDGIFGQLGSGNLGLAPIYRPVLGQ
jgi:alpha-tubulin suppressor-like RCC1 family protein